MEEVIGGEGIWFWDNIEVVLGDGGDTDFWEGMWAGSRSLKNRFPRLFLLSSKKEGRVADFGGWEDGVWRWNLEWRRAIRDNEKVWEEELLDMLQNVALVDGQKDEWTWKGSGGRLFSVKSAFTELVERRRVAATGHSLPALSKFNFRSVWCDRRLNVALVDGKKRLEVGPSHGMETSLGSASYVGQFG